MIKFSWLGSVFIATKLHAAEANISTVNLYANNYKEHNGYQLKSQDMNPDTKIFVSKLKADGNISMLEKDVHMMGSSDIDGANIPPELALQHGKNIKADTALVE